MSRGGWHLSPEIRLKMSLAQKGKKHKPMSIQAKKHLAKVRTGKKHSIETRKKMSLAQRGEKSYLWRGGIANEYGTIYHSLEYRLWREAVYERDKYTCQKCGLKSGMGKTVPLRPHHMKSFTKYPELRFAIDNGITLCKECHYEVHREERIKNLQEYRDKKGVLNGTEQD